MYDNRFGQNFLQNQRSACVFGSRVTGNDAALIGHQQNGERSLDGQVERQACPRSSCNSLAG